MRSWLAILVTIGCGCNDHGAGELAAIKDEVCACKTASCAETVMQKVPKAVESNHRTQTLARAMMDCAAKLHDDERPSTDPDHDHDEGEPAAVKTVPAAPAPAAAVPQ